MVLNGKYPSIAAKWAPTENCKIDRQRSVVYTLCKEMKWTKREYRQNYLSPLRNHLQVVERFLCDRKLCALDFDNIPSGAFKNIKRSLEILYPRSIILENIYYRYKRSFSLPNCKRYKKNWGIFSTYLEEYKEKV